MAHGLNGMPQLVQVRLVCTTADDGYVPGDEVVIGTVGDLNLNEGNPGKGAGCQISPDTPNLNIFYGNYASGGTFVIMNATTGQETQASNSNWNAVFIAWR